MLVLEMHLDAVQLGQLGVADVADVGREHFSDVGASLSGPFVGCTVAAVGSLRPIGLLEGCTWRALILA